MDTKKTYRLKFKGSTTSKGFETGEITRPDYIQYIYAHNAKYQQKEIWELYSPRASRKDSNENNPNVESYFKEDKYKQNLAW